MNALAAEGAASGIRVNAIPPGAATRMLRRPVENGTFTPERVAPGVAFLAPSDCTRSGMILHAADGRFRLLEPNASGPVALSGDGLAPEAIRDWVLEQAGDDG